MKGLLARMLVCVLGVAPFAHAAGVDYVRDVKPLLKHHCYSCHGALKQESKLRLDTAESARKGGKHGSAGEQIVKRHTHADGPVRRPHASEGPRQAERD